MVPRAGQRIGGVEMVTRKAILLLIPFLVVVSIMASAGREENRYYAPLPREYEEKKGLPAKEEPFIYDDADFVRLGKPSPGDWLDRFKERGQSFSEYKALGPTRRTKERDHIILKPLGDFSPYEEHVLGIAAEFCRIYFDSPVRLEDPLRELDAKHSRWRNAYSFSWTQYTTGYFLFDVLKPHLPRDALCYLGMTMTDLYPDESWNFVFGQASLRDRVGVYSLFRYFPGYFGGEKTGDWKTVVLRRSCKVMAHEIGHMFSLLHCIYYRCCMNGSNSLEEMDKRPIHLCPICLQKLQWNLGFDLRKRYEKLKGFYEKCGMMEESLWVDRRLRRAGGR